MLSSDRSQNRRIFIGDIHGQYSKLAVLMDHICSQKNMDNNILIFLGDLIDNQPGTQIAHLAVLERVREYVDAGRAICLMGNHEFNAIGWAMRHPVSGKPLRPHSENNHRQHQAFLDDVIEDSPQHVAWIEWFKSLPIFVDYGDIRAVHACWDDNAIARLRPWLDEHNRLIPDGWVHAFDKKNELYQLMETILKGPEMRLPEGYSFQDKTGIERRNIRVRWWLNNARTYRQLAQVQRDMVDRIPDLPLEQPYPILSGVPVVVGHYTLSGEPELLSNAVVCVDYNAAKANNPLQAWVYDSDMACIEKGQFVSIPG